MIQFDFNLTHSPFRHHGKVEVLSAGFDGMNDRMNDDAVTNHYSSGRKSEGQSWCDMVCEKQAI